MEHLLVGLVVAALIALAAYYIRVIVRTIRVDALPSSPRPSHLHIWRKPLSIALLSLALAAPAALAAPIDLDPRSPDTTTIATVECVLHDRDPDLVARAITANNPQLFKQLAATCHKLPDGPLSEPCDPLPPADGNTPVLPACFSRPLSVKLFVFDPLADEQTREWTLLSLGKNEAKKNPIDTFHIHRNKLAELLVIAVPESGRYTYALKTDSYSDRRGCPTHQKMTGEGEIPVHNRSVFVVSGTSCRGRTVWLEDWTRVTN